MYDPTLQSEFFNQTTLHPMGIMALIFLSAATVLVPRRYGLVPLILMACFVAPAQRFVFATLDFNVLRIMVLVGWSRVVLRREAKGWRWTTLDTALLTWGVAATVIATILHGTPSEFINRLGMLFDAAGIYFLVRVLVRDWRDLKTLAQCVAVIAIPVACAFIYELWTARNIFSVFGGVPEITTVRFGRLRCQGPFPHPILAGCFWAALMPLIGALWWYRGGNRMLAVLGVCASLVVVYTTASATPVHGVLVVVAGFLFFPMRRHMAWIRAAAVLGLVMLQLGMISPIWHLMARANVVTGASGWYRFKQIDDFVNHFHEWWLIGTATRTTWWDSGAWAITNAYVAQGIGGGLLTLLLFILLFVVGFREVGRICRKEGRHRLRVKPITTTREAPARKQRPRRRRPTAREAMGWALGVSLFVHCIVFSGVAYFGQTILVWYLSLGLIGSIAPTRRKLHAVVRALRRVSPPRLRLRREDGSVAVPAPGM